MPSCLLGIIPSLHTELARGCTVPIPLTLSLLSSITLTMSRLEPHVLSPSKPAAYQRRAGQPCLLRTLSQADSVGGIQPLGTILCVHARSPFACLLPAQQCWDLEAGCRCVGLTRLQTNALRSVTLCRGTHISGGETDLPPVKRSVI